MRRAAIVLLPLMLSPLFLSGCKKPETKLVKVEGAITLEGKPLPNVQITFAPDAFGGGTMGPTSMAVSDANGAFKLMCGDKEGAVPGQHLVMVEDPERKQAPQGSTEPPSSGRTHAAYRELKTTPLTAQVPDGGGTIKLELVANPAPGVRPRRPADSSP